VEEYYLYDPEKLELAGWLRVEGQLEAISQMEGWVSPRLGVRFQLSETELEMYGPNREPFMSFVEISRLRQQAEARAEQEQQRAQQAETLLDQERSRSQALESRLRQMGIDPDEL
jgi:hypothetical protein